MCIRDRPDTDESTESVSDDSRFDPFAALNLPPPVGEDDDSEEESSSEDHGPAISALDAGKKKKTLSEKSESFLASLGIGLEEESEEKDSDGKSSKSGKMPMKDEPPGKDLNKDGKKGHGKVPAFLKEKEDKKEMKESRIMKIIKQEIRKQLKERN